MYETPVSTNARHFTPSPLAITTGYVTVLLFVLNKFLIFKPLSYCFEEAIGFDVRASLGSRPVSSLIR